MLIVSIPAIAMFVVTVLVSLAAPLPVVVIVWAVLLVSAFVAERALRKRYGSRRI